MFSVLSDLCGALSIYLRTNWHRPSVPMPPPPPPPPPPTHSPFRHPPHTMAPPRPHPPTIHP
jgi:hypothetical protein